MKKPEEKKRGPEGPQRTPEDERGARGGLPPAGADEPTTGELSLMEARGPGTGAAAAAADDGEDVDREEEDSARQPGKGGGRMTDRKATSRGSDGAGARRAGTSVGLETVAEEGEGSHGRRTVR